MSTGSQPHGAVELGPGVSVDADGLRYTFSRAGGPGGQAVNKLSTKAELRVAVTDIVGLTDEARDRLRAGAGQRLNRDDELVLFASTSRSQLDNRRACLGKLRDLVAAALVVPKVRKATRPSRAAVERRLEAKRRVSKRKGKRRRPEGED